MQKGKNNGDALVWKSQGTVVLGKNVRLLYVFSEGCEIESRRQLEKAIIEKTNWKRITGTPAREQPLMHVRARSEKIGPKNQLGLDLKLVRCE